MISQSKLIQWVWSVSSIHLTDSCSAYYYCIELVWSHINNPPECIGIPCDVRSRFFLGKIHARPLLRQHGDERSYRERIPGAPILFYILDQHQHNTYELWMNGNPFCTLGCSSFSLNIALSQSPRVHFRYCSIISRSMPSKMHFEIVPCTPKEPSCN